MDYEQFYRYLDSRPPAEIAECLRGVTKVARKHSVTINGESEGENASQNHRRQIAEQVWFQHAVWNKFGTTSPEFTTLSDLRLATSSLFFSSDVANYLVSVNKMIDAQSASSQPSPTKKSKSALEVGKPSASSKLLHNADSVRALPLPSNRKVPNETPPVVNKSATSSDSDWIESSDSEVESASDRSDKASPSASVPPSRTKNTNTATGAKFLWTTAMDNALEGSIVKHKKDGWTAVAEHTGYNVSPVQCKKRWQSQLEPLKQGLKGGDWTNNEVTRLMDIVPKYTVAPYWSDRYHKMTKPHVSWKLIGEELGKMPHACHKKWVSANK